MQDVYQNIEEYNPGKKRKVLIVFDVMIADIISNKNFNSVVTELFIRGKRINILFLFIMQSYFQIPKKARPSTTHFVIMKNPNKRELRQIAIHQILTLKVLWKFIKNVLQKIILS